MATLVCFHAHPDDEVLTTGGTMAAAAKAGHHVVLVVATGGEEGEPVPGVLEEGEALEDRRAAEVQRAADVLGVAAVYFLGYRDSGMMGEAANERAEAFWQAPVDEAAEQLAVILRSEGCDVLTVYDDHGNYGHPDHIQVHRVGHAAARLAKVDAVYEATMNRDHVRRLIAEQVMDPEDRPAATDPVSTIEAAAATAAVDADDAEERVARGMADDFGTPEADITHAVDVRAHLDVKRQAMQAHASQIAPDSFFLAMPPEAFAAAFGTEWFIRHGHPRDEGAPFLTDLFG